MKFIKVSKDIEKMKIMLDSGEMDELPRDVALVIQACTELDVEIPENEEVVRVCEAIQAMMKEREARGTVIGIARGKLIELYELVSKGFLSLNIAAQEADQTEEEFKEGMKVYLA